MNPGALYREASLLHKAGRLEEAKSRYAQLIEAYPNHAGTNHLLGVVAYQEGRLDESIDLITKAIGLNGNAASFHNNLGNAYKDRGDLEDALRCYRYAVGLRPGYAGAYLNLGSVLLSMGSMDEAVQALRQSLNLDRDNVDGHGLLANIYRRRKQLKRAAQHYREVLARDAQNLEAHINLGGVLLHQGMAGDAERCYRDALDVDDTSPDAHFNLALALARQEKWSEAKPYLESTLALEPDHLRARYEMVKSRIEACDWRTRDEDLDAAVDLVRGQMAGGSGNVVEPWAVNLFSSSAAFHREVARAYGRGVSESMAVMKARLAFDVRWRDKPKLKIGYVSPDFRTHAVGILVHGMFALHDRDRFEIYGYSLADLTDEIQASVEAGCDVYTSIQRLSPVDSARRIHADGIDILVDLAGYTTFSRPEIFALRPAPVQVQYLGLLGTMGADFIDYTIGDTTVIDDGLAGLIDEQIVYMPDSFMVSSPLPGAQGAFERDHFGLPDAGVVFCCFNNCYKIDPAVYDSWMRILGETPGSVLWLYAADRDDAKENLRREASERGIEAGRIHFAESLPLAEHIGRLQSADIFLDTFQYNAGATGVGVLWAGVPMITCYGETFMQRMGASMLKAVGCEELVCHSATEYAARAIGLASDAEQLANLKKKLMSMREGLPLFDTRRFVANLERAYHQMWRSLENGQSRPIVVEELPDS